MLTLRTGGNRGDDITEPLIQVEAAEKTAIAFHVEAIDETTVAAQMDWRQRGGKNLSYGMSWMYDLCLLGYVLNHVLMCPILKPVLHPVLR